MERSDVAHGSAGNMPEMIDGYRILRVLGQGGMATVYAAQQDHPKRTVALKVMRSSIASPQMLRRFRKEIDLLARLRHPCIAQIYAAGTVNDGATELPYFTMEYIAGARTILEFVLGEQMQRVKRLKLFVQVCAAVDHGHRQRILHLDLKAGNVLVDREGHMKVIDFGVARAIEQPAPGMTAETSDTAILGSLHAMSPEQIDPAGRDLDARSDVYSLGVLLYRLMLGVQPIELNAVSVVKAARQICESPPRKPRDVDASIPAALEAVMLRALEKDPQARYRNAGSLGKALLEVVEGMNGKGNKRVQHDTKSGNESAGRSRRWLGAVAGVVLIGAIVGGVLLTQGGSKANSQRDTSQEQATAQPTVAARSDSPIGPSAAMLRPFNLLGHTGLVTGLSMNTAGDRLASAAHDRLVRLWDVDGRNMLFSMEGHEQSTISAVAINADATRIASGAEDGTVFVHETAEGRVVSKLALAVGPTHFLTFASDGALAGASDDLTVRIWNTELRQVATLRSSTGAIMAGCFSADSTQFLGGTVRGSAYVWDLETSKQVERYSIGDDAIIDAAFSADGTLITLLSDRGLAATFQRDSGVRQYHVAVAGDVPTALALDPHGTHLFVARQDRTIRVWNIETGKQVGDVIDTSTAAVTMAYNHEASRLAVGLSDGAVQIMHVPLAAAQP